jgi:AcrR family transcriptional regulator
VYDAPRQGLNARQAETVERLFAAGLAVLDEVGHEQLTIRMVASEAGVSPATAYTYLASKDHLFAELFWRLLASDPGPELTGRTALVRLQETTRHLAGLIAGAPSLAAAVNKSLLGGDPEVQRFRVRIGGVFVDRFRRAVGDDPDLLSTLNFAFTGALLQAGMGIFTYEALADRLDRTVAIIMKGNE